MPKMKMWETVVEKEGRKEGRKETLPCFAEAKRECSVCCLQRECPSRDTTDEDPW